MGHIISMFCSTSYYDKEAELNKEALTHDVLRVGICPDWRISSDGRYYYFSNIILYYRKMLSNHGARLIILNFDDRPQAWKDKLHGLIIPGGRDVDPKLYGQKNTHSSFNEKEAAKRWNFCKSWITEADPQMPIFGICYGLQVINCVLGGDLEQRIKNRFSHSANRAMKIREGSFLAKATGKTTMRGQCYHKQGLQKIPDWLQPVAWDAEDDSIHALQYVGDGNRKIIAVLWHPEACYEGKKIEQHEPDNLKIFQYFFGICGEYRMSLPPMVD